MFKIPRSFACTLNQCSSYFWKAVFIDLVWDQEFVFSFLQLYWVIMDKYNYTKFKAYVMIWCTYPLVPPIESFETSITSHIYSSHFLVRTFKFLLSKLQLYKTVISIIDTLLYIILKLITDSLNPFTNLSLFLPSPRNFLFLWIPFFFNSTYVILCSIFSFCLAYFT